MIDNEDFIDMKDMKQGWIQEKFEDIFDLVMNIEIFDCSEEYDTQLDMLELGINETKDFLKRLENNLKFINENM
ncbi:MAG: hypothetical protein ACW972_00090 [Promethearchaeota archaeon]|jgi:hypothetical protein